MRYLNNMDIKLNETQHAKKNILCTEKTRFRKTNKYYYS